MKEKFKIVFVIILVAQLMIACCSEKTIEVTIAGMESRALISDGYSSTELDKQNSIDKDELIIDVDIIELEEIVSSETDHNKKEETKVLHAAVVPCADPEFTYKNRIESIKVEVLDSDNNNERIDITKQVVEVGTQTSISEYISQNTIGIGNFWIEFSDTTNIPDRIEYIIEAILDDGTKIDSRNGIINFN